MSPDQNLGPQDPIEPYGVHGARGPLEYEIKFSCRGRRNGYYADLDHRCLVYHYCNTSREYNYAAEISTWTYAHFSFACDRGLRYDQVLARCIEEKDAITRCQDSELYFPSGDNPNDVPVVITSNNRLIPVRCPAKTDDVNCQIANDHIDLKGCSEEPGTVIKFYSEYSTDPITVSSYNNDVKPVEPVPVEDSPVNDPAEARDEDVVEEGVEEVNNGPSNAPVPPEPAAPRMVPVELPAEIVAEEPPNQYAPKINFRFRPPPGKTLYDNQSYNNVVSRQQPAAQADRTNFYPNVDQLNNQPAARPQVRWTHTSEQVSPRAPEVPANVPVRPSSESIVSDATRNGESAEADFLGLPIGSTEIVGKKIDTSFDCSNRAYGYYADVKNLCRVYHICATKTDEFGVRSVEHYSFVCAKGLMFDQQKITCVPERSAVTNCDDSERYYARTADAFTGNVKPGSSVAAVNDEVVPSEPQPQSPPPQANRWNIVGRDEGSNNQRTYAGNNSPRFVGRGGVSKVQKTNRQTWVTRSTQNVPVPSRVTSIRVIDVRPRAQSKNRNSFESTAFTGLHRVQDTYSRDEQKETSLVLNEPVEEKRQVVTRNDATVTSARSDHHEGDGHDSNHHGHNGHTRGDGHNHDSVSRFVDDSGLALSDDDVQRKEELQVRKVERVERVREQQQPRQVLQVRKVQQKQEEVRQEQVQQEEIKQEQIQQQEVRQEQVQQEEVRQEQVQQQEVRQEQVQQEQVQQQEVRQEQVQQEEVRQEQQQEEVQQQKEVQERKRVTVYSGGRRVVQNVPHGQRFRNPSNPAYISHNPNINQAVGQPGPSHQIDHNPRINQYVPPVGVRSEIDHNPSINQGLNQPAPAHRINHNPSISQNIAPVGGRSNIAHNPNINQDVGQPAPSHQISHNPSISQNIAPVGGRSSQSHNPNINQGVGQAAPSHYISHNPSITQNVAAPGGSSRISHNPSIDQSVGQGGPGHYISHNPSISQGVGNGAPGHYISHNPSIRQTIVRQDADRFYNGDNGGGHSISHNPSINQYVGQPSSNNEVISHNPSIYQVVGAPGSGAVSGRSINPRSARVVRGYSGNGSQGMAHNPSIHQVIVQNSYQRPSRRRSPSVY